VIWLGSSQHLDKIDISSTPIMYTRIPVSVSDTVRDLGVISDSHLTMSD